MPVGACQLRLAAEHGLEAQGGCTAPPLSSAGRCGAADIACGAQRKQLSSFSQSKKGVVVKKLEGEPACGAPWWTLTLTMQYALLCWQGLQSRPERPREALGDCAVAWLACSVVLQQHTKSDGQSGRTKATSGSDRTPRAPERQLCCMQPSDLRGAQAPQAKLRPHRVLAVVTFHIEPFSGQRLAAISPRSLSRAHLCCSKAGILLRLSSAE